MRTNIMLDDRLIKEAFKYTDVETKRDLIILALKEFIQNHSRKDLSKIKGKIKFRVDYDHKKLRKGA